MTANDDLGELKTPERLDRGLVIVLPGVEGYSHLNRRIARGLALGGVTHAIEIYDWTYGWFWQLWSLRSRRRHTEQATLLAGKIAAYQVEYPGRPVHLIGHSGGGAMIAYTLEALEPGRKITGGIMLVPACRRAIRCRSRSLEPSAGSGTSARTGTFCSWEWPRCCLARPMDGTASQPGTSGSPSGT